MDDIPVFNFQLSLHLLAAACMCMHIVPPADAMPAQRLGQDVLILQQAVHGKRSTISTAAGMPWLHDGSGT